MGGSASTSVNKNQPRVGAGAIRNKHTQGRAVTPPSSSDKQNYAQELLQLRNLRIEKRKAHRKALRDGLVRTCEIGEALSNDVSAWEHFIEADWGKLKPPKEEERSDAIRWAIKFWVGEGKGNDKKASFYFRAVGPLWKRTRSAKMMKAEIKGMGLRKLHDLHAVKRKVTKAAARADEKSASPQPPTGLVWSFAAQFDEHPKELFRARVGQKVKLTGVLTEVGKQTLISVRSWKLLELKKGA